jgi:hypothetical protein
VVDGRESEIGAAVMGFPGRGGLLVTAGAVVRGARVAAPGSAVAGALVTAGSDDVDDLPGAAGTLVAAG